MVVARSDALTPVVMPKRVTASTVTVYAVWRWGRHLGRDDQVTLVFALLVIHKHNHLARPKVSEDIGDGIHG